MSDLNTFKQQLAEMKKAREMATPGEWSANYGCEDIVHGPSEKYLKGGRVTCQTEGDAFLFDEDANFTCLAANNWLSLIEKLDIAIETLEKIETDFIPSHQRDVQLALSEIRQCVSEAIQKIVGGEC